MLRGCREVDLKTNLFGQEFAQPVILGPVGMAGMYRRRVEAQAAMAARAAGVPFCLSTLSLCSLAEVASAVGNSHLWFQLYALRDRAFMRDPLETAKSFGARVLVFTVDMPAWGGVPQRSLRNVRSESSVATAAADAW